MQTHYRFESAWLSSGWRNNVVVTVDDRGDIVAVTPEDTATPASLIRGAALPGMPNSHSHAFQRAMAGAAERREGDADSFWSWREAMYRAAERLTPEALTAIAAQTYVDMLKAGYTAVCEFHYVHNQPDGRPYADATAMFDALRSAAAASGIGQTLLPTLYQHADFLQAPPAPRQRRFVLETDPYLRALEYVRSSEGRSGQQATGIAFHSLRAVSVEAMRAVLDAHPDFNVIHIHVAEQKLEVERCVQFLGRRPIEWLDEQVELDSRWNLIHATHASASELELIARRDAVVVLCPTTEGNLGDGVFPLESFLRARGAFAIGSDSQVCLSPTEELRWLEYQARLSKRVRSVLAEPPLSTGATLWRDACVGGARASARRIGALAPGHRADIVVVDTQDPAFINRHGDVVIDTLVFVAPPRAVRDVMVGGRWLVQEGRHFAEAGIAASYRRALKDW